MTTPDLTTPLADLGPSTIATGVTSGSDDLAVVGPADAVFPLASVTKPLAAYAVLVAVEQGQLALDDDVTGGGRTVRHLLAHASGLPPEEDGRTRAPEERRVYSNWGFDLLGTHVEDVVGSSFPEWLRAEVLEPLEMQDTTLTGSPAKDASGTVADLLRFGRELLAPTLLGPVLAEAMIEPQWPDLDGVLPGYGRQTPNPWGLGVEIRGDKDPHWTHASFPPTTCGHFGQSGSFLWVSRDDDLAGAFLCDEPFGQWAVDGWPAVTEAQLAVGRRAAP